VKRTVKTSRGRAPKRSPKLPDELTPIVDAVVEIVFERLRSEASAKNASNGPPQNRKTARLNLPLPKQRTAFAEALADLLLADLASGAPSRKGKLRAAGPKPVSSKRAKAAPRARAKPASRRKKTAKKGRTARS
jgi:hypothetical protein